MGAWNELDTEISVDLDLSELDELINTDDEVFEPLKDIASELKNAIEKGSQRGVLELAKKNVSYQEEFINKNCDNPSGMLASSIDYSGGEYSYITGTSINDVYPMSIEYGHTDIYPIRAKALVFAPPKGWNGPVVKKGAFAGKVVLNHVNKTDPRPFVAPAYEKTDKLSEEEIVSEIGHAGVKWD